MSAEQAELRLDVEGDGLPYSEAEFQQHYGSSEQWERSPVAVFDEEKGTWKTTAPTAGFAAGGQEEAENGDSAADDNDGSDDTEQQEQQQQQPMSPPPKQPAVEESGAMSEQEAKRLAAIKAAEDFLATREPPAPAPAPVPSTVNAAPKRGAPVGGGGETGGETAEQLAEKRAAAVRRAEEFHAAKTKAASAAAMSEHTEDELDGPEIFEFETHERAEDHNETVGLSVLNGQWVVFESSEKVRVRAGVATYNPGHKGWNTYVELRIDVTAPGKFRIEDWETTSVSAREVCGARAPQPPHPSPGSKSKLHAL